MALGGIAAVVIVGALVGVGSGTGGGAGSNVIPFAVPAAAAAQLRRVADAASAQVMPTPAEWEYLEIKLENTGTISAGKWTLTYNDTQTEQNWFAPNGDARQRDSTDSFTFATPQDQATYLANKSAFENSLPYDPTAHGVYEDKFFPTHDSTQPTWVTSPPTDAQTLITEVWNQYVAAQGPGPHPGMNAERPEVLWDSLTQMLLSSTSAQLRATAYDALAYVPYTTVVGTQTDQLGRSGIAVSFTHDSTGTIQTLIVSPTTGNLLELDRAMRSDGNGMPAGTVIQRQIFLQRVIVPADVSLPGGRYLGYGDVSETTAASSSPTTTASASDSTPAPAVQTTTASTTQTSTAP
jgi:hypothetical protein